MALTATSTRNARHGAAGRVPGGLRKPAMVRAADYDETRIELDEMRREARAAADYLEPRLSWMVPVSIELGPAVYQTVIGCIHRVDRLRKRATA